MADFALKLEDAQLNKLLEAAIMSYLTPEAREKVITEAIQALITPPSRSGDKRKSALQEAFEVAVYAQARTLAEEVLSKDEVVLSKLRGLITEAVEKATAVGVERERTVEKIAGAISQALRGY